jgi:hypothetical protein
MSRLFDVYFAVDWSARNVPSPLKPSKDAIWVGEKLAPGIEDPTVVRESYWNTRFACQMYLRDRLMHHVRLKRRVFIGFDFAYGYPTGFAKALGLNGNIPPWRKIWNELSRLIVDDKNNCNNRFEVAAELNLRCGLTPGPFWGCPATCNLPALTMKSPPQGYPYQVAPDLAIDRLRWVDKRERGVQPIWKLIGSGSVGGQSLVGIPTVCRLRDDPTLQLVSRVWPFETGFTLNPTPEVGPFVLHGEIWPGVVPDPLDRSINIRDQAQVRAVVHWLCGLDTLGQLSELFTRPADLSTEATKACIEEEGWIIGGGLKGRMLKASYEQAILPFTDLPQASML